MQQYWSLTEAAETFGITKQAVGPLVDALGINTKSSRLNPRARLLDRDGMARVARALERSWPPVESAVPA
jgi:hypothetical protein